MTTFSGSFRMGDNPGGHVRMTEASGGHVRMGDTSGGRDMRDREWDRERERLMMSDSKDGHG